MSAKPGDVIQIRLDPDKLIAEAQRSAVEIGPIRPYTLWIAEDGRKKMFSAPWKEGPALTDPKGIEDAFRNPHPCFARRHITGYSIETEELIVYDGDGEVGMKSLGELRDRFPSTRRVRTRTGGEHIIYRNTSGHDFKTDLSRKVHAGVDIKCGAGIIIGAGSWVVSSGSYETIDESLPAPAPEWMITELIEGGLKVIAPVPRVSGEPFTVAAPLIDSALAAIDPDSDYGTWRDIGMALHSADHSDKWIEWSAKGRKYKPGECEKLLDKFNPQGGITISTLFHHAREADWVSEEQSPYTLNDLGNAQRLTLAVADRFRYIADLDMSMVWSSRGWVKDRGNTLHKAFKKVIDTMLQESTHLDSKQGKPLYAHAKNSGNAAKIKAACDLAKMESPIRTLSDEWDSDGDLITFSDGTVLNIRRMESRPMHQGDLIRRRINAPFDMDAKCPEFDYLIGHLVSGNKAARNFILQLWSTGLVTSVLQKIILVIYGAKDSGKTTVVECVKSVLGDFAVSPAPSFILRPKYPNSGGPNAEIVNLLGKRAAFIPEFPRGRLDDNKLKILTGGDTLSVRRLYSNDYIDVPCRLTITISSNSKPFFDATDGGMLTRIRALYVRRSLDFKKKPQRTNAIDWIVGREAAGIAALLVRSLRELIKKKGNLAQSKRIADDTAELNLANDRVAMFLEARCIIKRGRSERKSAMYKGYVEFCEEENHQPFIARTFHEVMRQTHGFREKRVDGYPEYKGVELGSVV